MPPPRRATRRRLRAGENTACARARWPNPSSHRRRSSRSQPRGAWWSFLPEPRRWAASARLSARSPLPEEVLRCERVNCGGASRGERENGGGEAVGRQVAESSPRIHRRCDALHAGHQSHGLPHRTAAKPCRKAHPRVRDHNAVNWRVLCGVYGGCTSQPAADSSAAGHGMRSVRGVGSNVGVLLKHPPFHIYTPRRQTHQQLRLQPVSQPGYRASQASAPRQRPQ